MPSPRACLTVAACRCLCCTAVFVTRVDPNYAQPWQKCPQRSATGSAFVLDVEKHIIVTNAHVVGAAAALRPAAPQRGD